MEDTKRKQDVFRLAAENIRKQNKAIGTVIDNRNDNDPALFLSEVADVCDNVSEALDDVVELSYSSKGWQGLTDREAELCAAAARLRADCFIKMRQVNERPDDLDVDEVEDFLYALSLGQCVEFLILCNGVS